MALKNAVNGYVEGVEKMSKQLKAKFGEMAVDADINGQEFELVKELFNMLDASTRLIQEQANTISDINCKLDKLLQNTQRRES